MAMPGRKYIIFQTLSGEMEVVLLTISIWKILVISFIPPVPRGILKALSVVTRA
jgi:hypothetical protein